MEREEIINVIKNIKKGTYVSIHKVKDLGEGVTKHSIMLVRMGIDFANMKVNEGREVGELPWGEWEVFPYVIKHKGTFYLRVYNSYVEQGSVHSFYQHNGVDITKEEAIAIVGEQKPSKPSDCYTIKFDNIVSIGE